MEVGGGARWVGASKSVLRIPWFLLTMAHCGEKKIQDSKAEKKGETKLAGSSNQISVSVYPLRVFLNEAKRDGEEERRLPSEFEQPAEALERFPRREDFVRGGTQRRGIFQQWGEKMEKCISQNIILMGGI